VGDDPRERQGKRFVAEPLIQPGRRRPRWRGGFPQTPLERGSRPNFFVGVEQQVGIRVHDVVTSPIRRDGHDEPLPLFGEERRQATSKEPMELRTPAGRHAPHDERGDPAGMPFGICDGEQTAHDPPATSQRSTPRCSRSRSMSSSR
jgi:hypothetical protein